MNLLPGEAVTLAEKINTATPSLKKTIVGITPTTLALTQTIAAKNAKTLVGAQNAHWEKNGAFTGEVSAEMLKAIGTDFIIIAHSERRHKFAESQELINQRSAGVLSSGLKLVYCIGETEQERSTNQTFAVLESQLKPIIPLLNQSNIAQFIIAYEPVWAIGTGKVASLDDITNTHRWIVDYWKSNSQMQVPPILYGGSVTAENYAEIIRIPEVAGALVGGASLKAESFLKLIAISEES